jgi:hypothetical protein
MEYFDLGNVDVFSKSISMATPKTHLMRYVKWFEFGYSLSRHTTMLGYNPRRDPRDQTNRSGYILFEAQYVAE